ncbi:SRP54-type protein, GTPase domain [Persephonella hydrogeniphila]|uniref:SRP54-type protein, GTPase domain n=1 Tax=Persephonella hydrogeniphila TaxID=198703 RepID=A0A285NG00_9AQUI|nr:hypothetical protein [Persephonella hydrogeniphila]SNZ08434.1 SRP54-type protein, GTPase domain [Persephonella hydrogeniphila]
MKMKKYTVENLQKGWMQIREELGESAIILSIKEINGIFEILAASPQKKTEKKNDKLLELFHKKFSKNEDIKNLEKLIDFLIRVKDSNLNEKILSEVQDEILRNYLPIIEQINRVDILKKIEINPLTKKYINVLGNISSGKSTTIAKLAAILKFNRNKKIAVASFDFYKIGGSESLKKFAEIIQIPFFMIKDEKDLIMYKDSFDEFEHILFDTPGNIKDLSETEKLLTFISSSSEAENILTIPLTKKETLIDRDINYFSKFKIHHLILTKIDELENKIPLYFVLSNYDYKISYITNGLNVPKDIVEASQVLNGIFEVMNR